MVIVQSANLLLRFLLELSALGALGYWGFHSTTGLLGRLALGIGAPLVAAVIWAIFVSPNASVPLSTPGWLLVQGGVFGAAMVGLMSSGRTSTALVLGLLVTINGALMYVWGQ